MHNGYCQYHETTTPHYCGGPCCAVLPRQTPRPQVELNDKDRCDSCNGQFSTTSDPLVECETDSQVADHEFVPQTIDPTFCEVDGWMKIEHDLSRNLRVHESCFLDHDDILVRVDADDSHEGDPAFNGAFNRW